MKINYELLVIIIGVVIVVLVMSYKTYLEMRNADYIKAKKLKEIEEQVVETTNAVVAAAKPEHDMMAHGMLMYTLRQRINLDLFKNCVKFENSIKEFIDDYLPTDDDLLDWVGIIQDKPVDIEFLNRQIYKYYYYISKQYRVIEMHTPEDFSITDTDFKELYKWYYTTSKLKTDKEKEIALSGIRMINNSMLKDYIQVYIVVISKLYASIMAFAALSTVAVHDIKDTMSDANKIVPLYNKYYKEAITIAYSINTFLGDIPEDVLNENKIATELFNKRKNDYVFIPYLNTYSDFLEDLTIPDVLHDYVFRNFYDENIYDLRG